MENIRRSPVEVGSFKKVMQDFCHQQYPMVNMKYIFIHGGFPIYHDSFRVGNLAGH